jgi:hypothetical protein
MLSVRLRARSHMFLTRSETESDIQTYRSVWFRYDTAVVLNRMKELRDYSKRWSLT